jgi:hypothetical protein
MVLNLRMSMVTVGGPFMILLRILFFIQLLHGSYLDLVLSIRNVRTCVSFPNKPHASRNRYVYYYSIKLNRRFIYECRCDERLKAKAEGSTRLTYTGLRGGLEHLKIETSGSPLQFLFFGGMLVNLFFG